MKNEALLHEAIESGFKKLKGLTVGSEEYEATVNELTKLIDRAIEIDKINIEYERVNDEKKDRWIKHGLTAAGIILPLGVTVWGTFVTINFEKEGVVSTLMGRGFFNRLIPKK